MQKAGLSACFFIQLNHLTVQGLQRVFQRFTGAEFRCFSSSNGQRRTGLRIAALTPVARETLQAELEIPVVSLEDVYGGKLVAAMDRQHPRDLFDVQQLFAHEGITPGIRRAFVVYLASHNRPVHEVLFPAMRDIGQEYEYNFRGMTTEPVELGALRETRARMIQDLQSSLDADERSFLLSLVNAQSTLLLPGVAHVEQLPAIRWKLLNLDQLRRKSPAKFAEQADLLARRLT